MAGDQNNNIEMTCLLQIVTAWAIIACFTNLHDSLIQPKPLGTKCADKWDMTVYCIHIICPGFLLSKNNTEGGR